MAITGSRGIITPPPQIVQKVSIMTQDIITFQHQLGIPFHDTDLLIQALTHRSYANEYSGPEIVDHNERLEFLGDAVLDFIAGDWLYQQFPKMREGKLTRLRSALVCTEMLADFARELEIDRVIRLGYGEAENGGRTRKTNLCGAFEAVVGAMYLDQGLDTVREFIIPLFTPALDDLMQKVSTKDPKSRLQEWSQGQPEHITPNYYTMAAEGPDHSKWFTVEVRLENTPIGWGHGHSKRHAEQAAALDALRNVADE